jgi:hypothetical protein
MDTITRNTITLVQEAFFDVCDLLHDAEGEARDALIDLKDKLATIEERIEEPHEALTALDALVVNYAQFGRVTDAFVRDCARMLEEIKG